MSDINPGLFFPIAVVSLIASCVVAAALGNGRTTWAWGLLGPFGWVAAGFVGVFAGLERIEKRLDAPVDGDDNDEAEAPCTVCHKPIRRSWSMSGKRVMCPHCGARPTFTPENREVQGQ